MTEHFFLPGYDNKGQKSGQLSHRRRLFEADLFTDSDDSAEIQAQYLRARPHGRRLMIGEDSSDLQAEYLRNKKHLLKYQPGTNGKAMEPVVAPNGTKQKSQSTPDHYVIHSSDMVTVLDSNFDTSGWAVIVLCLGILCGALVYRKRVLFGRHVDGGCARQDKREINLSL